jgi:hypothetical protein
MTRSPHRSRRCASPYPSHAARGSGLDRTDQVRQHEREYSAEPERRTQDDTPLPHPHVDLSASRGNSFGGSPKFI